MPTSKAGARSQVLTITPLAVNSATAAAMLGQISETTFFEKVSRGELPKPRKIGQRSVWLVAELEAAANNLPISDDKPQPSKR